MAYKDVYASWQADPEGFWMEAARAIDWDRAPSKALFDENAPLYDALNIMEKHQITVLPVIDSEKKVAGVLHLHDILGKGAVKFNGI